MALSTQRALPCLPCAESAPRWKYDVFLSFRGEDTRWGFISHLYDELQRWPAIKTFKDDRELEKGAPISPELLSAIKQSHLAIVVFSPNYATSTWCLDELKEIVESMKTRRNTILPVFLGVDPSDVRHQRRSFDCFAEYEVKFSHDMVERWKVALTKVAKISGFHSKNYESERNLIEVIVEDVRSKMRSTITLLDPRVKLVGIDFGLEELGRLLDLEVRDVRFIGIWGMGGVGKTTLAKLVFDRISHQFEVREFLGENIARVWDEREGIFFIPNCMFNKKVLLVVDDVDCSDQLKILVRNKSWFGEGSRILVTTRNERLLIENDIEMSFRVIGVDNSDALELFSHNAFKKDQPEEGFLELSKCFVDYAEGLPLALIILGCVLYKRDIEAWNSELNKLKQIPHPTIFQTLKLSYDALDVMEKEIFLDVAFFHKGMKKGRVIEMLDRSGFSGRIGIDVLIEKSLLTIDAYNNVGMHSLVQEMGGEIVCQESEPLSRDEPGLRSRLCHRNDVFHIFMRNTGTEAIKGISLCLPSLEDADLNWNCEVFSKMSYLRFLKFDNFIISSGPKFLPNSLRILQWNWYPSKFLPANFRPNLLGELEMQNSKLVRLWDGKQDLPNLKTMNLSDSKNLIKTPDFTGIPNLEVLNLANCTGLVEIDSSIAFHKKLKRLNLHKCASIKRFPSKIEMDSLALLNLWGCSKVKIPEFGEGMKNLSSLSLCETASEELPSSIEHLVGLTSLLLYDCKSLNCLPSPAIFKLKSLEELSMNGCSKLKKLAENTGERESSMGQKIRKLHEGLVGLIGKRSTQPLGLAFPSPTALPSLRSISLDDCKLCDGAIPDDIGCCFPSLERLELCGNNFVSLPASIECLSKLNFINLSRCKRLRQLPALPSNRALHVQADDCASLNMLSEPSKQGRFTNLEVFKLTTVNCYRLGDEEGFNNGIFSLLRRLAAQGISPIFHSWCVFVPSFDIVSSGSQISEWFNIQNEGDSLTLQLPPPDRKSEWTGIMFCVVFADQKNNPTVLENPFNPSIITCFSQGIDKDVSVSFLNLSRVKGDHIWVFYMSHSKIKETTDCDISFSFDTCYSGACWISSPGRRTPTPCSCMNSVKKCGARLLYEQDLKQLLLDGTINTSKRSREFCD